MDAAGDNENGNALDLLTEIDNACLDVILSHLPSAQDLLAVSAACKRLYSAARTSSAWLHYISVDFGLHIQQTGVDGADPSAPAYAEGPHAGSCSGLLLYKQLTQARLWPKRLPLQAVCTDGGCDEPYDAYWAGNLFIPRRSVMYCSEANTRNIHVFARMSSEDDLAVQQQQAPQTGQQQQAQNAAAQQVVEQGQRREFLLSRCCHSAKHVISQHITTQYQKYLRGGHCNAQPEQQISGSSGILQRLYRRIGGSSAVDERLAAATLALRSCSTEGLADFFLAAYLGQQLSSPWAQALFNNLSDEEIQQVHMVAFQLWGELMDTPVHHKFITLPLPHWPEQQQQQRTTKVGGIAVAVASSSSPSHAGPAGQDVTAVQQPQQEGRRLRQLLCAEEQLTALAATTSPGQNTCIVHECIVSRDGNIDQPSTCPVASGILFLGYYQHSPQATTHYSSSSAPLPAAPGSEPAAAAAAARAAAPQAVKDAAAALGVLTHQPWVSGSNNMTTVNAVFAASAAGLLPPVIDYAATGAAEYIEFAPPTGKQLQQQQQEWLAMAGSSSSSSSGASWPACGFLVPVLWFRFPPVTAAAAAADDEELLEEDESQSEAGTSSSLDDAESELSEDIQLGPSNEEEQAQTSLSRAVGQELDISGDELDSDVEAQLRSEVVGAQDMQVLPQGQQQHGEAQAALSAAAQLDGAMQAAGGMEDATAAQQQASAGHVIWSAAPRAGTDSPPGAATSTTAAAAPAPRAAPPRELCPAVAALPAAATEAAAALGWYPSGNSHPGMLYVRLQKPRAAKLLCVKLLECEDVKPAFNRSRGGCNIDMQLVMLRGHHLGQLPAGLAVAGLGQWGTEAPL